jgi:hypothetical protein
MQGGISERLALNEPLSPARILIFGGILIAIVGMLFGEYYAIFHLHQSGMTIESEMLSSVQAVARGDDAPLARSMANIGKMLENMGTKKDTHTHWIQLAYLCLILGLVQPYIRLGDTWKRRWAVIMVASSFILPVGVFTIYYLGLWSSPFETIGWGSIVADAAGAVVTVAVFAELVGAVRYFRSGAEAEAVAKDEEAEPAKSLLLRWGAVLILLGLVHGAYYAATGLYQNAEKDVALLEASLTQAMANDVPAAEQAVRDYNWLQAEKAIYIATHTHFIEFGLMAVLLAFAQRFVFLSDKWKLRWARALIVGGLLLPLAVQSEIWSGLYGGAVADLAGFMVVAALSGMMLGVIRHTGAMDARGGMS